MHKGHIQTRTRFLQGVHVDLQGQLAHWSISFVFRVCVKVIIDPRTDHLQDHPMGRNPNTLAHILGAFHPRSGVAIRQLLRKLQSSPEFKRQGARIAFVYVYCLYLLIVYVYCLYCRIVW
jgi:hypothetical protein